MLFNGIVWQKIPQTENFAVPTADRHFLLFLVFKSEKIQIFLFAAFNMSVRNGKPNLPLFFRQSNDNKKKRRS